MSVGRLSMGLPSVASICSFSAGQLNARVLRTRVPGWSGAGVIYETSPGGSEFTSVVRILRFAIHHWAAGQQYANGRSTIANCPYTSSGTKGLCNANGSPQLQNHLFSRVVGIPTSTTLPRGRDRNIEGRVLANCPESRPFATHGRMFEVSVIP